MEDKEKNIERIDKYLLGRLSPEESKELERELLKNKPLENTLYTQAQIQKAILLDQREEMKVELKEIHKNVIQNRKDVGPKKSRRNILVTLICGVIAALLLWYFIGNKNQTTPDLFASNYEAFETGSNVRGENIDENLELAFSLYKEKNYEKAVTKFNNYLLTGAINNEVKLALAISYFETQKIEKAQITLQEIIDNKDPFYTDHARWYQGLIYLSENEMAKAKISLQILADDVKADHHTSAKSILRSIE